MKNLLSCGFTTVLMLAASGLLAQTAPVQNAQPQKEVIQPQSTDRGSAGAITMEEYQTLLDEYQKANPGKNFQDMRKEEFETYLTNELSKLRQRKAEELKKAEQPKSENPK